MDYKASQADLHYCPSCIPMTWQTMKHFKRGANKKQRAKIRGTTAITPTINRSNITKFLSSDAKEYDLAKIQCNGK